MTAYPKYLIILLLASLLICCADNGEPTMEATPFTSFQDGFEATGTRLAQLLPRDNSRWTSIQVVDPPGGDNFLRLDMERFIEGSASLRVVAAPTTDVVSKANIEKGGFFAPSGHRVRVQAELYIEATESLENLFLIDLECCSCWDASVADNQCPGVRLKLSDAEGFLSIERGKILGSTISQSGVAFPTDEWVKVVWEMDLSPSDDGWNRLYINGRQVIDEAGKNLPNAGEFAAEFARNGIDFQLREPVGYERVQIGATANSSAGPVELWVDDFVLEITEL